MKYKIKNDKYRKNRGGTSKILKINCFVCKHEVCTYQKDGPGALKRMYLDRILIPVKQESLTQGNTGDFICPNCKSVLGTFMIYKLENRQAYRLFVGAITKKLIK